MFAQRAVKFFQNLLQKDAVSRDVNRDALMYNQGLQKISTFHTALWVGLMQVSSIILGIDILRRCGFRGGPGGPAPSLSDHTTIIKFSGPVLSTSCTHFPLSSNNIMLLFVIFFKTFFHCRVSFCNITNCKKVKFLYNLLRSSWWY